MPYCHVVLPLPLKEPFDYSVPDGMAVLPGMRVSVPFGRRNMMGMVVGVAETTALAATKAVTAVLDAEPLVSDAMLKFTRWVADYYLAGWGEALQLAFPPYVKGKRRKVKAVAEKALIK